MRKFFNTSAVCVPERHYMVDIAKKLEQIKEMVDQGQYFTINRARQYGKTTTLRSLRNFLRDDYFVISVDFQSFGSAKFRNENVFSLAFAKVFFRLWRQEGDDAASVKGARTATMALERAVVRQDPRFELQELFESLSDICQAAEKGIVLIIDEVDSAANQQVFLDFLAQLRFYYIERDQLTTFQSVILASVYDIKNLKRKFISEEEHKPNSPWNIAADFLVDMSFSSDEIAGMLMEYEVDHETGMDVQQMAKEIYAYTSGYPFLVSRICKLLDERVTEIERFIDRSAIWTKEGLSEAVKLLITEKNALFESLVNKLTDDSTLRSLVYAVLFDGKQMPYNSLNEQIEIAHMFGFIKNTEGAIAISNRIFETVLYDLFLGEEALDSGIYSSALSEKNQFVQNGRLDMRKILERFVLHFHELYGNQQEQFYEEDGRRHFLLYLKPIINGTGNYYIEAQTRDMRRTDVIVDYRGEQFVIELKIWRGDEYNARGEAQLAEYLDYYHLKKGYMISFNFNQKKRIGVNEVVLGDKTLVEAVV